MRTVSNTQIGMFLRCPRQWEFRYVKGLKIPPKGVLIQGSAYHGALSENFRHKMQDKRDLNVSELLDAYDTYWNARVGGKVSSTGFDEDEEDLISDIDWEDNKPEELKDEGANLVKLYHEVVAPRIHPLAVEERVEKRISEDVNYLGYIDLEQKTSIVDHKLKSRGMSQDEADRDPQPFSYCLLKDKGVFNFHVAVKAKKPYIQIVQVRKNQKARDWWVQVVEQVVIQMNRGVFPANPSGWWCGEKFCGYFDLCKQMTSKKVFMP